MASSLQKENIPPSGRPEAAARRPGPRKSIEPKTSEPMQGLRVRGDPDGAAQPSPLGSVDTGSRDLQEEDETLEADNIRASQSDARPGGALAPFRTSNLHVVGPSQDGVPVFESRNVERQAREELPPELLNQMLANCLKLASENVRNCKSKVSCLVNAALTGFKR